jgi:hypothetical protein
MAAQHHIFFEHKKVFKIVFDDECKLSIYRRAFNGYSYEKDATQLVTKVEDYKKIWFGYDPRYKENELYFGNTILINIKDSIYMYIGDSIYYFRTDEPIIDFVSEVSNGISFPYVITDKGYLLLSEQIFIPKNAVSYKENFYTFYYKNPKNTAFYNFKCMIVCENYLF